MLKKSAFTALICFFLALFTQEIFAEPLESWNEGPAKKKILEFVKAATDENGPHYIPISERIATFDQDGTLWVEQPLYTQFIYALDHIKATASEHPEWSQTEPFQSILKGDTALMKNLTEQDIAKIVAATHSGMTTTAFQDIIAAWLKTAVHPRYQKPFTELIYQPMLEVIQLLKDNAFDVYIVSGGGQEFIRVYSDAVYHIPKEKIIGSASKTQYTYIDGKPVLLKLPELLFINDKQGKPEGINLIIGKRPVAAFGNSTGDQQMLEWTQAGKGINLELLIHHDDAVREYAYGPDSKIGTFSEALMEEAKSRDWIIVSMKNDWKVIFPCEKQP